MKILQMISKRFFEDLIQKSSEDFDSDHFEFLTEFFSTKISIRFESKILRKYQNDFY